MEIAAERDDTTKPREIAEIARLVLTLAGIGILGVSAVTLVGSAFVTAQEFSETTRLVFNALLPLLGTWVGTVLAYYFSRKNFESASQSVERLVTLTAEQKLGALAVGKEMMTLSQITLYKIPRGKTENDVTLSDLRNLLGGKITRLPITDADGVVKYIVHQSGLYKFLAEQALSKKPDVDKLTLQDLVNDAQLKNWISNIAYVSESETVADAKNKMETQLGCQDLIVTKTGSKTDAMIGWMTNVDIGRLSKA